MADLNDEQGQFVYFGLSNGLQACVDMKNHESEMLDLIVNADGMPISTSGVKQMRAIACKVHYDPDIYKPFPVAVFFDNPNP